MEKIKKSLYRSARKNFFKSKIKEVKKVLYHLKINRNRKKEKI